MANSSSARSMTPRQGSGAPHGSDPFPGDVTSARRSVLARVGTAFAAACLFVLAGAAVAGAQVTVPDAPSITVTRGGSGELAISWMAPNDGGSAITGYAIRQSADGGYTWTDPFDAGVDLAFFMFRITLPNLVNGTTYTLQVRAINDVGTGRWSISVDGTPATFPDAPVIAVGLDMSGREIEVSWTAVDDGGAPVTSYTAEVSRDGAVVDTRSNIAGTVTTFTEQLRVDVEHSVRVQAVNDVGAGDWSAPATITPVASPLLAMSIMVEPGDRQLTVRWGAPNMAVASWVVQHRTPDTSAWTASGSLDNATFEHAITGLTSGDAYEVRVGAVNDAGDVAWSAVAEGTPIGAPAAPDITLTAGSAALTAAWSAPFDGGRSITRYELQIKEGAGSFQSTVVTAATTSHIFTTGVSNGQTYTVRLRARNNVGDGPWSAETSATLAATVPHAPAITVTPASEQVDVSWVAPYDGGSAITSYDAELCTQDASCVQGPPGPDGPNTAVFENLRSDTFYTVRVRATNAIGDGPWTTEAVTVGTPHPPEGLQVNGGDGSLALSWSKPATDNGEGVVSYQIYLDGVDHSLVNVVDLADPENPTHEIRGEANGASLTNGRRYAVQVAAINARGVGGRSDTVHGTPVAAPGSPGDVRVETGADPGTLEVSWSVPDSRGGAIAEYRLQYRRGENDVFGSWVRSADSIGASDTKHTLQGLDGGAHQVQVAARNEHGWGEWSDTLPMAEVIVLPDAPADVAAQGGSALGALDVTWSAPASDGGSPVRQYQTRYTTDGGTNWSEPVDTASTGTSITLTGLTNYLSHGVQVRAQSAAGDGNWSATASATVGTAPGAPGAVAAAPGDSGELVVTWAAPEGFDASLLDGYRLRNTTDGGDNWSVPVEVGSADARHTFTGLDDGTVYGVQVQAFNAIDSGPWSGTVEGIPVGPPGAPTVTLAFGDTQFTVEWTAVDDDGGSSVTGYDVRWRAQSATDWTDVTDTFDVRKSAWSHTITGLTNGTAYEAQVRAVNAVHPGDWSAAQTVTPSQSATLSALSAATDADVALRLTPAFSSAVRRYAVRPDGAVDTVQVTATAAEEGTTLAGVLTRVNGTTENVAMTSGSAATLSNLAKGDNALAITVTAADGTTKTYTLTVKRYTRPGAVTFTATVDQRGRIQVDWTEPQDTGGLPIDGYRVDWGKGGLQQYADKHDSTARAHTITGVDDDAEYHVLVRARNALWLPSDSGHTTVRTLANGAPTAVIAGDAARTVGLNAPLILDGSGSTDPDNLGLTYEWTATNAADTDVASAVFTSPTDAATVTFRTTDSGTYTVTLTVTDAGGDESTAVVTIVDDASALTVPGAPTGVTAARNGNDGELEVEWTAPASDGGAPVTHYDLRYTTDDGATYSDLIDTGTETSYTLTGLVNGTAYSVEVRAVNGVGDGNWSAGVEGIPATRPGTPVVAAAPGTMSGELDISWTPPDDGGAAISSYTLELSTGGAVLRTIPNITGAAHTLTDLITDTEYSVRLQAINEVGTGEWSAAVTAKTPLLAMAVTLVPGDGRLSVRWSAPDLAVASFQVQHRRSGADAWTSSAELPATTFSHPITGLTNGDDYEVRVGAANAAGHVDWSAIARGGPRGVPAAPAITLSGGTATLTADWTAPADGGSPILGYTLQFKGPTGEAAPAEWQEVANIGAGATSHRVTGLTNGQTYTVRLHAFNSIGASAWSAEQSIPLGASRPDAPILLVHTERSTVVSGVQYYNIVAAWRHPHDGGSAITGYQIQFCPDDGCHNQYPAASDTRAVWNRGNGIAEGSAWTVRLWAVNAYGESDATVQNASGGAPRRPVVTVQQGGSETLIVQWLEPETNGSEIIYYGTYLDGVVVNGLDHADNQGRTITGLTNGHRYRVEVDAVNARGFGARSEPVYAVPVGVPEAPTNVSAESGIHSLTVSWHPADDNGSPVIRYEVQHRLKDTEDWSSSGSVEGSALSYTIENLVRPRNGLGTYEVQVRAINGAGDGGWSAVVEGTVITAPDAPSGLVLQGGHVSQATDMSWNAPVNDGGSAITQYQARYRVQRTRTWGEPVDSASSAASFRLTGLTNGTNYEVQVRAQNAAGESRWSDLRVVNVGVVPAPPGDVKASPGESRELVVTWSPSANVDESLVQSYRVHYRVKDSPGFGTRRTEGPITNYTLTGLTAGAVYEVKVATRTNILGNYGVPVEGVPVGPPAAPEVTLTPGPGAVGVEWTAPESDGGSPVTGYDIRWRRASTTTWFTVRERRPADARSYTLTGFRTRVAYEVEVRAVNAVVEGAYSETKTVTTRVASTDAMLSDLSVTDSDGGVLRLEPSPFTGGTYNYVTKVGDVDSVNVTVTTRDPHAKLDVVLATADHNYHRFYLTTGTAGTVRGLARGDNRLDIHVTAEDGRRVEHYSVRIVRTVPPTLVLNPVGNDFVTTGGPSRGSMVHAVQVNTELPLDAHAWDPDGLDEGARLTYEWRATGIGMGDVTPEVFAYADRPWATFRASRPGDYQVRLTVTDDDGQTVWEELRIRATVERPNRPPTVEISGSLPPPGEGTEDPPEDTRPPGCRFAHCVRVNTELRLTALAHDPDGTIAIYDWGVYSGRNNVSGEVLSGRDTAAVTFNAAATGVYRVVLHVFDDRSASASAYIQIEVRQAEPSSDATLHALSVAPRGNGSLTLTPSPFSPTTYAYLTAVGEDISWVRVTAAVNDSYARLSGSLARADGSPAAPVAMTSGAASTLHDLRPGDNVLTVTVTAEDGATQDYTLTVKREGPPTAVIDPSEALSVKVGTDLELDGSGSTDSDGGAIVAYVWEAFGSRLRNVTVAAFGTAEVFGPTATFNMATVGDYTVWLTVIDDEGATSLSKLNVKVLPRFVVTDVATRVVSGDSTTGDRLEARVTFAEPVTVDTGAGEPTLGIAIGGERREAAYESGSGTAVLVFVLEVPHNDPDAAAAQVIANGLQLNGSTIQGAGGVDAVLVFGTAPRVSSIAITEAGGEGVWYPGDEVEVTVTFTEPVVVDTSTARPVVDVVVNGYTTRPAWYESGSGTDTLVFIYTVSYVDVAVDWVTVEANSLIPYGEIRSTAGLTADVKHPKVEIRGESVVRGPALSVEDASIVEGVFGPPLEFVVRLSGEATEPVSVDYETVDGTAIGGLDYIPERGTLFFAPGETEKVVQVLVLDDLEDEGIETFRLVLFNPRFAGIEDGEGVGTIHNTDPMPAAWLGRFGRTVAEQALEGVSGRMKAPRVAGLEGKLGGQGLTGGAADSVAAGGVQGSAAAVDWSGAGKDALWGHNVAWGYDAVWGHETGPGLDAGSAGLAAGSEPRTKTMTARELLLGSSFTLTGTKDAHGGSLAFWGRGAQTRFDGREDALDLDGTVTTGMLGADYSRGPWMVGLALTHGSGEGGYTARSGEAGMGGEVESSLTAAVPYAAWRVSDRLRVWGAAGFGTGAMTLVPDGGAAMKTDVSWSMAAAGMRGELMAPPGGQAGGAGSQTAAGPALALISDALWARTSSDRTSGLVATESDVTRFRVGLEGSWTVALAGGGRLVPKLELGARHDGGDADTGAGVDLGGGIAWSDPALGLSLDVEGRTLLASEADGRKDRGFAAALVYDPDKGTKRGPSFSLRQDWGGEAKGGIDALFAADPLSGRGDTGAAERRWEAEAAYGFAVFGGRFTASPHAGVGFAASARDYSLGWKVTREARAALDLSFALKATLRENADAEPEYRTGFEFTVRW